MDDDLKSLAHASTTEFSFSDGGCFDTTGIGIVSDVMDERGFDVLDVEKDQREA